MGETIDLPLIWAAILSLAVFIYVVLDGFDLGIGILFPYLENDTQRDEAMNTVAPVWDGNETWLILGGGGLFAAFPLAYAIVMPALYAPFIVMMLALVFRGVSFEYRWRDRCRSRSQARCSCVTGLSADLMNVDADHFGGSFPTTIVWHFKQDVVIRRTGQPSII